MTGIKDLSMFEEVEKAAATEEEMLLSSLPEDIQVHIFLKLPVQSLLSCRRACKIWCSIICTRYFIKTHGDHAIRKPRLMLQSAKRKKNNSRLRSVDYDSILSASLASPALPSPLDYASDDSTSSASQALSTCTCDGDIPMDGLIRDALNKSRMLGTCNGLICMALNSSNDVFIWNPTTGEYKKVQSPFPTTLCHSNRYGFYYDCIVHDYKLVRITDSDDHYLVDVYTIGSGSWKKIPSINHYSYPVFHDQHVIPFRRFISAYFLNGAFHWLGVNTKLSCRPGYRTRVIVSFDVSGERFADILFPEDAQITYRDWVLDYVAVLEDCLSLCTYHHRYTYRIDIWLMQEYGVTESWTKRFSLRTNDIYVDIHRLKPLWSFSNGELLIVTGEDKLLYDPKNDSFRILEICNGNPGSNCGLSMTLNYVESLISPNDS